MEDSKQPEANIIMMSTKAPLDAVALDEAFLRIQPMNKDHARLDEETSLKDQLKKSTIHFYGVYNDPTETVDTIKDLSGIEIDESLTRAAYCGAFLRSLGAETIIYMSSYGGTMIATGLLIRFAGFDILATKLAMTGFAVASMPNARILFNSLIKPPADNLPDDKKALFDRLNKYAFMPLSWVIGGGAVGGVLTYLGDTNFGTQQVVGATAATFVGPLMLGLRSVTRTCLKGSIIIDPEYPAVKDAFNRAYSDQPNPQDNHRSHRWGMARDTFNRGLILSGTALALILTNTIAIQTFCIDGKADLENILANNGTITNDDLNTYCTGGSATYLFREIGLSLANSVGMLIVEPVLNNALNKVYDYFYPTMQDEEELETFHQQ
ncbi:hypothetical protein [Govanella unica]|uniref:Uncharacterized protein n=1 Tax=Govanella unica TaxID=2975056 RepID=A0A9X3Z6B4_9PROT|nr:hypothetical protein [Govania unica]MDA5192754.1 hypothetical protein [Govania unica]